MQDLVGIFTTAAAYIVPAIAAAVVFKGSLFTNKQQQETLITRFGKHVRTVKEPGLTMKIPLIDKVYARIGKDVMQATETLQTKTSDDLFVGLPISVQFEISDSALYTFKNRDATANMMKSVSAAVRTATAKKDFQELYSDRDELSTAVIEHVKEQVAEFGINLIRIIIDEPTAPAEVQAAFNRVRASERVKEAVRNEAEAAKITTVAASEGSAIAQGNAGRGAAEFRKEIMNGYTDQVKILTEGGVTQDHAWSIIARAMTLDTMREIAKEGNVIIVPENFSGADLSQLQTYRELASGNHPLSAPVAASAGPSVR